MKAYIVCVLSLALSLPLIHAQQQQQAKSDGYWWNEKDDSFKIGFVSGYVLAMVNVSDVKWFECLAERNGGKVPEVYPGKEAANACGESPDVKRFKFGGYRNGQWRDGVDEFYKDYRNRGLAIPQAMWYVKQQLEGTPAKQLEDEVTEWRRTAVGK